MLKYGGKFIYCNNPETLHLENNLNPQSEQLQIKEEKT